MTTLEPTRAPALERDAATTAPRLITLDSLRGIAAFTVMMYHYLLTLPAIYSYGQAHLSSLVRWLEFSPLHLAWAGYEAVLLFFVLSGFVLALPYWSGHGFDYGPFVMRRVTRVWLPYIVVVTLAGLAAIALARLNVPGTSTWFNGAWRSISLEGYLNHLLLIGDLDRFATQFVPVVWSLKYEMLASLAFPVLLYVSRTLAWPVVLALSLGLSAVGEHYASSLRPFQFVLMFVVGVLLARHKDALIAAFQRLSHPLRLLLLIVALGLYVSSWLIWHENRRGLESMLLDWAITAASAFAIIAALASGTAHRLLSWPPVVWLGRVSYSVYLSHTLVLLAVVHLLGRSLPLWTLLIACVPLTLLASAALYHWVERPAIRLGRRLSHRQYL